MVLPSIVFSLLGGILADRNDKRTVIVATNVIRGFIMLVFAILTFYNTIQLWHLYVFAVIYGSVSSLGNPAFDSILPEVVEENQLQNANSLFLLGDNVSSIIGPALGGAIISLSGIASAIFINSLSFFVFVAGISVIKISKFTISSPEKFSIFSEAKNGINYALSNKIFISFLTIFTVINISAAILSVSLPLYVTEILKQKAGLYALYLTAMNIGIFLGVLIMSKSNFKRKGRLLLLSVLLSGVFGYILLGFTREIWLGIIAVIIIDGSTMVGNVLFPTWIQSEVPMEYRGRAFGLTGVVSYSLVPVGFAIAGASISYVGAANAIIYAGILLIVTSIVGLLFSPLKNFK
jgi:MFS family permease